MCDLFTAHNGLHMGISKGHEWKFRWLMVVESGQSFEKHMWKIRRIKQTNQIPQPFLARLDRHEQ